jgi:hypothetical protein
MPMSPRLLRPIAIATAVALPLSTSLWKAETLTPVYHWSM